MDDFEEKLNAFLTTAFNGILRSQEQVIRQLSNSRLSISELHLIEAVARCKIHENTVSDVAQMLDITNSSVTIAVNKLVLKGYLKKVRNESDGRSVYIELTDKGTEINEYHKEYHRSMIRQIAAAMTDDEKRTMLSGMEKLVNFFAQDNFKNFMISQSGKDHMEKW